MKRNRFSKIKFSENVCCNTNFFELKMEHMLENMSHYLPSFICKQMLLLCTSIPLNASVLLGSILSSVKWGIRTEITLQEHNLIGNLDFKR